MTTETKEMGQAVRRVGKNVFFDGMTWPLPDGELEWRLRYTASPSKEDVLRAASILSAYSFLVTASQRIRNLRAAVLKREFAKTSGFTDAADYENMHPSSPAGSAPTGPACEACLGSGVLKNQDKPGYTIPCWRCSTSPAFARTTISSKTPGESVIADGESLTNWEQVDHERALDDLDGLDSENA